MYAFTGGVLASPFEIRRRTRDFQASAQTTARHPLSVLQLNERIHCSSVAHFNRSVLKSKLKGQQESKKHDRGLSFNRHLFLEG